MVFGFGEGKINISLEKYSFSPGETIRGKLVLSLNKPKQARSLRLVFRGIEKMHSGGISVGSGGLRHSSKNTERPVYNFELKLDGEHEYSGTQEYSFEIAVPKTSTQAMPEGTLGSVLGAARFLSGTQSRVEWFLDASLDCSGLDVNKKVQVSVQ